MTLPLFVSLGEPIHTSQHSLFCVWSFRQLDLCERNIKKSSKSFIIRENPALNLTVTDTKNDSICASLWQEPSPHIDRAMPIGVSQKHPRDTRRPTSLIPEPRL